MVELDQEQRDLFSRDQWKKWVADGGEPIESGWEFVTEEFPQVRVYRANEKFNDFFGIVAGHGFILRGMGKRAKLTLFDISEPYVFSQRIFESRLESDEFFHITKDNFVEIFEEAYGNLEKITPFWTVKVSVNGDDDLLDKYGFGWSEEEAFDYADKVLEDARNISVDEWKNNWALRGVFEGEELQREAESMRDYYLNSDFKNVSAEPVYSLNEINDEVMSFDELKAYPQFDEVKVDLRKPADAAV